MSHYVKAKDVIDARRWFVYSYVEGGSGFFVHESREDQFKTALDLFDDLVEFMSAEGIRKMAKWMRKADRATSEPEDAVE